MFQFDRKESECLLKVKISIPGAGDWTYTFSRHEEDVPDAQLTVNAMEDWMNEKLKAIREDSYNEGWKDAKAKKKKRDWFAGWW